MTGVLNHRLQDALGEVGVQAESQRSRPRRVYKLDPSFGGKPGNGFERLLAHGVGVCGTPSKRGVVAGGGDERVHSSRQLLRVSEHVREGVAVISGPALLAEGELCLRDHARERRAQLVRKLGREALLATETGREPL
jgi:hypothetical protein